MTLKSGVHSKLQFFAQSRSHICEQITLEVTFLSKAARCSCHPDAADAVNTVAAGKVRQSFQCEQHSAVIAQLSAKA